MTELEKETESQAYLAHNFLLNGLNIKFRKAKITPTKIGQFVTLWKRNEKGITEPYDISDKFEYYIIATRQTENFGLFIFPKSVLYEHKILSDKTKRRKTRNQSLSNLGFSHQQTSTKNTNLAN